MVFWVSNRLTRCHSGFAVHAPAWCCWACFFLGVSARRRQRGRSMIAFSAFRLASMPVDYSVFRPMETFGLFHSSRWAHASSVCKTSQFDTAQGLCQQSPREPRPLLRARLSGWRRHSPAQLNLPGAAFLLGLDGFDVITWDIVSRGVFFFFFCQLPLC